MVFRKRKEKNRKRREQKKRENVGKMRFNEQCVMDRFGQISFHFRIQKKARRRNSSDHHTRSSFAHWIIMRNNSMNKVKWNQQQKVQKKKAKKHETWEHPKKWRWQHRKEKTPPERTSTKKNRWCEMAEKKSCRRKKNGQTWRKDEKQRTKKKHAKRFNKMELSDDGNEEPKKKNAFSVHICERTNIRTEKGISEMYEKR